MSIYNKVFADLDNKTITYKDARFYACQDDPTYFAPSATTVLSVVPKGVAYYEWLKKEGKDADLFMNERMEVGSKVHELTEIFDKTGSIDLLAEGGKVYLNLEEVDMFHRYIDFSRKNKVTHELIEESYGSKYLGYGGTLDRVCRIKGLGDKNILLDIKTGNKYEYYKMQLASYKQLFEWANPGHKIDYMAILYLNSGSRTPKEKNGVHLAGYGWELEFVSNYEEQLDWFNHHKKTFYQYKSVEIRNQTKSFNTKIVKDW